MGPSLARIMEQCHVGQPIAIIHMAASTQNLRVPGTRRVTQTREGPPSPPPLHHQCPYLAADDVDLVLDLGHPLTTMANSSGMVVWGQTESPGRQGRWGRRR